MPSIYELYGRLAEQHSESVLYHQRTQELLMDLAGQKVKPSQLVVSQTGWEIQHGNEESGTEAILSEREDD